MTYELEVRRVAKEIKASSAKRVLLQLPDGLKPKATQLASQLEELTGAEILIWAGSNFGACDVPTHVEKLGVDVIINFGHAEFKSI